MTPLEFYKELEAHDWYHHWSDDNRVYFAGRANHTRLNKLAAEHGYFPLLQDYERHVFSGPSYGTPQAPKPKPPTDTAVELLRNT